MKRGALQEFGKVFLRGLAFVGALSALGGVGWLGWTYCPIVVYAVLALCFITLLGLAVTP